MSDARSTRSALLDMHNGTSAFDLLVEERSDEAGGRRRRAPSPILGELSAEAKAARAPFRLEELVEAQHNRLHRDSGRARAARTVRNSRRGTT